jgi:hypothetical protein
MMIFTFTLLNAAAAAMQSTRGREYIYNAISSSSQTCSDDDDDDVLMIVIISMMYLHIIQIMMRIGPFTFNIIV